jgi:hypothetical protein
MHGILSTLTKYKHDAIRNFDDGVSNSDCKSSKIPLFVNKRFASCRSVKYFSFHLLTPTFPQVILEPFLDFCLTSVDSRQQQESPYSFLCRSSKSETQRNGFANRRFSIAEQRTCSFKYLLQPSQG